LKRWRSRGVLRIRDLREVLLPSGPALRAHMDPARRRVAIHRAVLRAVVFLRHRRTLDACARLIAFVGPSQLEDLGVPGHVHEPVAADVERDRLLLPALRALLRLVDRARDAVRGLGCGEEPLGPDGLAGPWEDGLL